MLEINARQIAQFAMEDRHNFLPAASISFQQRQTVPTQTGVKFAHPSIDAGEQTVVRRAHPIFAAAANFVRHSSELVATMPPSPATTNFVGLRL